MGFLDRLKGKIGTNLKVTQLSFMTQPDAIVQFCRARTAAERTAIKKGIEDTFKWQSVAQVAQRLFPSYHRPGGGVSDEAFYMATHGQLQGGVNLLHMESQQQATTPQYGLQPMQQAALSFAWVVLRALEQEESASG